MQYMTIGNGPSARKVSVLNLGAMRFGTTTDEATSYAILEVPLCRDEIQGPHRDMHEH
jgi:aryl-alcohol dehydrogenase-like predicted oxidoreductase